jgi:inward rectifier potassium channel
VTGATERSQHPSNLKYEGYIEIFVGMCSVALTTGVIFARFSRPKSKILFARSATISTCNEQTTLSVRVANERSSIMTDIRATMWVIFKEVTDSNAVGIKVHEVDLQQSHNPALILFWSLTHVIDESSPLHGKGQKDLENVDAFILLSIEGFNSTIAQVVHSKHTWSNKEILWQHRYIDMAYE